MKSRINILRTIALATIAGAFATTVQAGPGPEVFLRNKPIKKAATRYIAPQGDEQLVVIRYGGRGGKTVLFTPAKTQTTVALMPKQ